MRSIILKNKRGSTSVEKVAIIILLIAFMAVAILIILNVFHFSLFGLGETQPRLTTQPAVCSITFRNFSTSTGGPGTPTNCCYEIIASSGSPGVVYGVYSNLTTPGKLGSYLSGNLGSEGSFSENVTISSAKGEGTQYFDFLCNTSGSSTQTNGYYYSAGGEAQLLLGCGNQQSAVGTVSAQTGVCS